ncbi:extracellular solute-binding protein [Chthonobacter rhizosphaerae]|uniref:extracellular solute-binding protein n=1 Tax=Chthonobacter rhizosphaerae TaxID=2735553 RepID=UPI0015EF86DE|nr:extracellular solute-binding protein [Chthonobacter rhizosphaerae]
MGPRLTRLSGFGRLLAALLVGLSLAAPAAAADGPVWRHATALAGTPKYGPDARHFDYVNPAAPKGGTVRLGGAGQTFDTLNPILPKGVPADGLGLVHETLMTSSLDELDISAMYGLLAEAISHPDDYSSVSFRLRPEARWQDGQPVTPEDVIWSFDKLKALNPTQRFYYQHVVKAEKTGEREVTFTFDETGNRELPHIVGQLLVLPKHWWEGKDASGNQRSIENGTLEPPLGSGPYRIARVDAGRSVTYERVPDYWGADLMVNVGTNNFDRLSYEYYRDLTVEFEAFKADKIDYWTENEAKRWNTGYDIPPVRDGRIIKEAVELEQVSGVMVGFIPNIRRPLFQDRRVRQALNYAFDFEELNKTLFYGQYQRIDSFFYGIPLASAGLPQGQELEILEKVREQVPAEVFTQPYANPVGGTPENVRNNLRRAVELFREAGYRLEGNRMIGPDGRPVEFELLLNGPTIERVALPYAQSLKRIGVTMTIRSVDSNQFITRVRSRDYDMIYSGWGQSMSPGNEQMNYWGSAAADSESSSNYAGIKDPAVDALIREVVFAKDRATLEAATRALDRVLLGNQFVIPSYTILTDRIAYWNRFSHPDPLPRFDVGFPTVWWFDADKAAKTGGGG